MRGADGKAGQCLMRLMPFGRLCVLASVLLQACLLTCGADAQSGTFAAAPGHIDFKTDGIRFQIKVSIVADNGSPNAKQTYDHNAASLAVKIRISAHATESQFFGTVSKTFSSFPVHAGSGEKLFWQDARCHQRRGLPKTTVAAIDGSIATDNGQIDVRARPRQMGLPLPADEIAQGTRLPPVISNQRAPLMAFRSESKASHLLVDVKIYASNCNLR
jgi:hypothetical protein